jgi:hypothetical protein
MGVGIEAIDRLNAPKPAPMQQAPGSLRLELVEGRWEISLGQHRAHADDADGMHYIEHLVGRPGEEVHVLDLLATRKRGVVVDGSDASPILDAEAKQTYRKRLVDLRDMLEEAEAWSDSARAERARAEIGAIEDELARAVGLGGRDRKTGSAAERGRVNVTQRIRRKPPRRLVIICLAA